MLREISSIRKPPASITARATGSSRSAASSLSTTCRPANSFTPTSTRNSLSRRVLSGCTGSATNSSPTSRFSPPWSKPSRNLSATPASSFTTRLSTWVFSMRSIPGWGGGDRARRLHRYSVVGPSQASRRIEQPRCPVLALWHRQFPAHQARRAPRRGDFGRSLHRADRRQTNRSRPHRPTQRAQHSRLPNGSGRIPGDAAALTLVASH